MNRGITYADFIYGFMYDTWRECPEEPIFFSRKDLYNEKRDLAGIGTYRDGQNSKNSGRLFDVQGFLS